MTIKKLNKEQKIKIEDPKKTKEVLDSMIVKVDATFDNLKTNQKIIIHFTYNKEIDDLDFILEFNPEIKDKNQHLGLEGILAQNLCALFKENNHENTKKNKQIN